LILLSPLSPTLFTKLTFVAGLVALVSVLPNLGGYYKKPVYIFLVLAVVIAYLYKLPFDALVVGVNSMLPIVAIMTVLQIFTIPVKIGQYDQALKYYLQVKFKQQSSLHLFLLLATYLFSIILGFGSVPTIYAIFHESLISIVSDYKRFIFTAVSRGFALSTFWAPAAMSAMLALQVTGAPWFYVFLPAMGLTVLGVLTTIALERKESLAGNLQKIDTPSDASGNFAASRKKVITLVVVAVALVVIIAVMEQCHILTNTTRILVAGLIVACIWGVCFINQTGISDAWWEYWRKNLTSISDMSALFMAMGIFSQMVDQAGVLNFLQAELASNAGLVGQYSLLLVPPLLVILSYTGIHPFISLLLIGKLLCATVFIPHREVLIALSMLLGGVISYSISPFAGTVLFLSRLLDCQPGEVALKWNGSFAAVFLLEGLIVIFLMQMFWR